MLSYLQEELFLEKLVSLLNLSQEPSYSRPVSGAAQVDSIRQLMERLDRTPLLVRRGNYSVTLLASTDSF